MEMHFGKSITERQCEHAEHKEHGCPRNNTDRQATNFFSDCRNPDYWSGSLFELAGRS
jgi:hypothetical protein